MDRTITVHPSKTLVDWLARLSATTGVPQKEIVRRELEKAMARDASRPYLHLAGMVRGAKDLSTRSGFMRS
jgi:hypothetical protein